VGVEALKVIPRPRLNFPVSARPAYALRKVSSIPGYKEGDAIMHAPSPVINAV